MEANYNYEYSGNMDPAVGMGFIAGMFGFMFIIFLVLYVFYAICLMKIAKKSNTPNAWLAWIPIANIVLMLQVAKKPIWWIVLFFVPLVNLIITVLIWAGISAAMKKPEWLGILILIPIANLVLPAYLAFSSMEETPATPVTPA